jgi:hypothetical protein
MIQVGVEELRHAVSSQIAGGLFGGGASEARPSVEGHQPEPAALSLAAVRDGMDRGSAAKIGGMDRQTLRDGVHRFNASGPDITVKYRVGQGVVQSPIKIIGGLARHGFDRPL